MAWLIVVVDTDYLMQIHATVKIIHRSPDKRIQSDLTKRYALVSNADASRMAYAHYFEEQETHVSIFTHTEFDNHEQVMFCHDSEADLFAIIAIHSTALRPAAGGCRMYPYESVDRALTDVLRL